MVKNAADCQRKGHVIAHRQGNPFDRVVLAVGGGDGHRAGHVENNGHDKPERLRLGDDLGQ